MRDNRKRDKEYLCEKKILLEDLYLKPWKKILKKIIKSEISFRYLVSKDFSSFNITIKIIG